MKNLICYDLFKNFRQHISLWFSRKALLISCLVCAIFPVFFWLVLLQPFARPQDIIVTHLFLLPFLFLTTLAGCRKGYHRLLFYPLLLVLITAAEMLNFDFSTQYNVERTLRYGCTLSLLLLLADIGLTMIGNMLKIRFASVIVIIAGQLSVSLLFVGIIIRNIFGGKPLETDTVSAVFQTDLMEAFLFVVQNPSLGIAGIILLIAAVSGGIWYHRNKWFPQPAQWGIRLILVITGIVLCLISATSVKSLVRKGKLSTFALLVSGNRFRHELAKFNREAEARKLVPLSDQEKKLIGSRGADGRFILIIGESNSRKYMSCYGYHKLTTPFLDKMKNDERFTFFNNVYSNHVHTNDCLKYLFSEQNQYDPESKFKVTLFDVLRYCGYRSTFISNQYFYDSARSPVSAIAQAADTRIYLNDEMDFVMKKNRLDMETVSALKKQPVGNREVIVIHLMSCHAPYQLRYPAGFRSDLNGDYERAVAYLDKVLQEIFEYSLRDKNIKGVIFVPDHGEDVILGDHDSAGFTIDMTEIPMICYFSSDYTHSNPELKKQLKSAQNKVFTNDLIFDFMLDTMGIKNEFNIPELHLLSDKYQIDINSGRTLHGRSKLDGTILKKHPEMTK